MKRRGEKVYADTCPTAGPGCLACQRVLNVLMGLKPAEWKRYCWNITVNKPRDGGKKRDQITLATQNITGISICKLLLFAEVPDVDAFGLQELNLASAKLEAVAKAARWSGDRDLLYPVAGPPPLRGSLPLRHNGYS